MTPRHVDTHCHLQFEQYDEDREEIIRRMHDEEIAGIVVGDDYESSAKAVELAEKHENLYAAVGIHPHNVMNIVSPSSDDGLTMSQLRELAQNKKVVAIGECGLDYFMLKEANEEIKNKQKEIFKKHIALAIEMDKPLMIHGRTPDAYQDAIAILRESKNKHPNLRGNVHFFSGSVVDANALFSLGFTISFTAVITFARDYDEIIKTVPLTSILSETDAPLVAPASRRGERNDPLAIIEVVQKIAEIRNEDLETVRATLLENAKRLLRIV